MKTASQQLVNTKQTRAWHYFAIFIAALSARLGLDFLFFARFGPHTAGEKEIWYYYNTW